MPNKITQNPSFSGGDEEAAVKEEKETPTESASENNEQVEETPEAPKEESVEEPVPEEKSKAVEGLETELEKLTTGNESREKDLRQQVVEQRRKRRELRKQEQVEEPVTPEPVDDLSDIDEESKKSVARILKAGGYMKVDEAKKLAFDEAFSSAEASFFQTHSEYLPENDENDLLYNALDEEVKGFARPNSSGKISQLFEKAHKLVKDRYPSRFSQPTSEPEEGSNRAEVAALAGGRSGVSSTPTKKSKITQEQIDYFQSSGWKDEDIKELMD